MGNNVIGQIPEFTQDTPSEEHGKVSDKSEETIENPIVEEKDTPSDPPTVEQPADPNEDEGEDIGGLKDKLREELRKELLPEIEKEINGLKDAKKAGNKTYLVINKSRFKGKIEEQDLKLIQSYPKGLRLTDSRQYIINGPQEELFFFELTK